jgi:hypothetical protein
VSGPDHEVDLDVSVPDEVAHDYLSKLHHVSESLARFAFAPGRRDRIVFALRDGEGAARDAVAASIAEVARKMCRAFRPIPRRVLVSNGARPVPFREDPYPSLRASGELHEYGPGRFAYGPTFCALIEFLDGRVRRLARAFAAESRQFPSLIGADALARCKYLRSFPHALTLVTHLREDLGAITRFASSAAWDGQRLVASWENLAPVRCLLSSALCFHYYALLQGTRQAAPRTITALGRCYRYEAGNLAGVERLWDFTMREIVFVGDGPSVLARREEGIRLSAALLDELGLAYDIETATDPFFTDTYAAQTAFQGAFELKFEARAALPWKNETLAVASFNHHKDMFGRAFDISLGPQGAPVDTGCIGFGLERLAFAFLAQYGLARGAWPEAVREGVAATGGGPCATA